MAPRKKKSAKMSTNPKESNSNKSLPSGEENKKPSEQRIVQKVNFDVVREKILEKQKELEKRKLEIKSSKVYEALNNAYTSNLIEAFRQTAVESRRKRSYEKKPTKTKVNKADIKANTNDYKNEKCRVENSNVVQLSKREMHEQLEGVTELLRQLVNSNPDIKKNVYRIARNIPKMKKYDLSQLFVSDVSDSEQPTCSKYIKNSNLGNGSPKIQKNISNTQNKEIIKEVNIEVNTEVEPEIKMSPSKKRRNRRELKKSFATEQEDFVKYINSILKGHFTNNPEHAKALEFTSGDNIELYAQRLVEEGLGLIVEDEIHVNRKNNRQSFICMSTDRSSGIRDGMILSPVARMYAFDGDTVRAFVFNTCTATENLEINDKCKMDSESTTADDSNDEEVINELYVTNNISDNGPKAFVITIVKQKNLRQVVGAINFKHPVKLNDEYYYKLKPHDMRIPMVFIPQNTCAEHVNANAREICGLLYVGQVIETDEDGHCIGELLYPVGKVGNIEAETKAILMQNGLSEVKPYESRFDEMFASACEAITANDLIGREDLRKCCVFTIDPLTARDLDDALSIETLAENEYEVGVHISDVSYYLAEDSELDDIVKTRATSIYLVNEVIHMLPQPLCFKCSLLPGEDKFAFSVFWRMNANGDILGEPRFTRSVIKSCSQFAYEHAQKIIDNPNENFDINDFPTIVNGFTTADIVSRVLTLHKMAVQMRARRYENGALSINNPKIRFSLDPLTGEPLNYEVEARIEANFLIEEFMLLANQAVAKFIYDSFPEIAFLRFHEPPLAKSMKNVCEKLQTFGITLRYETSKALQESINRICGAADDPEAMEAGLNTLLTKPMARAKYYCSGTVKNDRLMSHYALSIPIYTHFTSPIRRYPDVLVHRLLAAALKYCAQPQRTIEELEALATICNDQKFNAKNAGDDSKMLFFKRYLKIKKSIDMPCVVTEVYRTNMTVVSIETGQPINIIYKQQKLEVDATNAPSFVLIKEKFSTIPPTKLQIFSKVNVNVVLQSEKIHGFLETPDKKQRKFNNMQAINKKCSYNKVSREQKNATQLQIQQLQLKYNKSDQRKFGENVKVYYNYQHYVQAQINAFKFPNNFQNNRINNFGLQQQRFRMNLEQQQFFQQQRQFALRPGGPFIFPVENSSNTRPTTTATPTVTATTAATTTAAAPTAATGTTQPQTTNSAQYFACLQNCATTSEYNPVCGSDNQNYHNMARLLCASRCGLSVSAVRMGTCAPLGR